MNPIFGKGRLSHCKSSRRSGKARKSWSLFIPLSAFWTAENSEEFSGILNSKSQSYAPRSLGKPIPWLLRSFLPLLSLSLSLVLGWLRLSGATPRILSRPRLLFPPKCPEMRNATLRRRLPAFADCPRNVKSSLFLFPPLYSYPIWLAGSPSEAAGAD